MGYVIREIDVTYASDWLRLRDQLWPDEDHWPEIQQFFAGGLEEPNQVLLAFDPTNLAIALVELSIRDDIVGLQGIQTGYIEGLLIDPSHRSFRLVLQLLRAAERWAFETGCEAFASDRADRVIVHQRYKRYTADLA